MSNTVEDQDPKSVKRGLMSYTRDRLRRSSHKTKEFKLIRLCGFVKDIERNEQRLSLSVDYLSNEEVDEEGNEE